MKIHIFEFTKNGIIRSLISRKSLKNYVFFDIDTISKRNIWIKKKLLKVVVEKVEKSILRKPKFRKEVKRKVTKLRGKEYIRFKFPLWRYKLDSMEQIDKLFISLKKKYKSVKIQGKKYGAQRIGLKLGASKKQYMKFIKYTTKKINTKEVHDFISTSTCENNEEATEPMFDKLQEKITLYNYNKNYVSLLEFDLDKVAIHFYIWFIEE